MAAFIADIWLEYWQYSAGTLATEMFGQGGDF